MSAAGLVHTGPNQRAACSAREKLPTVNQSRSGAPHPSCSGSGEEKAAWLTSSLRQQTLPHILRKQRGKTMSGVRAGGQQTLIEWAAVGLQSDPAAITLFSLFNAVAPHCCFTCSSLQSLPLSVLFSVPGKLGAEKQMINFFTTQG